jgi:hypothetical protein
LRAWFCTACSTHPSDKYSKEQKNALLDTLAANIFVRIDDFTSIHHEPANKFIILTKSLLDSAKAAEYKENGVLYNQDDDIEDFVTYKIIDYQLKNEKNEQLQIKIEDWDIYLQETSMSNDNGKLYRNLFSRKELNGAYEQLLGNIKVKLAIPPNIEREIDIPVNISINDEI